MSWSRRWQDDCVGVTIRDPDRDPPCVSDIDPRELDPERETTEEEHKAIAQELKNHARGAPGKDE